MNIAQNIIRLRESVGMNKNQCAIEARVTWHIWDNWEHGLGPSKDKLPVIANVLQCEIAELFKEPQHENPAE